MEILSTAAAVRAWRAAQGGTVGFVPTMGALHAGHLTLVRRAGAENDRVIASIFVNPLQFGPREDFDRYPRELEGDRRLLQEAGVDALFYPEVAEMYPPGFDTRVEVGGSLTAALEGKARPGHFAGVTTVVGKLFLITQPTRAYFGMKDAQQLLVIAKFVRDLQWPITIVPCATVREADGLALSSRNRYLQPAERAAAAAIPQALAAGQALFDGGERRADPIRAAVRAVVDADSLLQTEYVSCADLRTLEELAQIPERALLSLAVRIGRTRLIDNHWLGVSGDAVPLG